MLGCLQRCAPTTFCLDTDWIYIARRFASAGQPIATVRSHHVRTASINPSRSEQTVRQPTKGSRQRRVHSFPRFLFQPSSMKQHSTTSMKPSQIMPRVQGRVGHGGIARSHGDCNTICCRFQPRHRNHTAGKASFKANTTPCSSRQYSARDIVVVLDIILPPPTLYCGYGPRKTGITMCNGGYSTTQINFYFEMYYLM